MIEGSKTENSEKSYREKTIDSSSSLKDFSINRKLYYKKYILFENVEEKDNQASVMGRLVETLLLEPEEFDNRFYMSACASTPTGLMLEFVEALYRATRDAMDDEGIITREFKDISTEAYNASGFKIKYEAVISKFVGSDAEIYFNEILKIRANGLTVATADDVANAERIVDELKNNFVTREIVNLVDSERYTVKNQLQVEGFNISGLKMKSMLDKVIIDHQEKVIRPYDLKCTWSVENFYKDYYLYRLAYIQAFVYNAAMQEYRNTNYPSYKIEPLRFIVCDSTNYYNPLIYALTLDDLVDARDGFVYRDRDYPGVLSIIEDLKWAQENNIWNISKNSYINNGVVKLK